MNADHYTYRVRWSDEDQAYVATVAEFGSLSWLDEDRQQAIDGIVSLVCEVLDDLRATGEPVPAPMADHHYSGTISLRIPPELHRALAIDAAEQKISLNRLISQRLAHA
jgi:predicted HicB family RNase H-like nuclease